MIKKLFNLNVSQSRIYFCGVFFIMNLFSQQVLMGLSQSSVFLKFQTVAMSDSPLQSCVESDEENQDYHLETETLLSVDSKQNTFLLLKRILKSYPFFVVFTMCYWTLFFICFFVINLNLTITLISFFICFIALFYCFLYFKIINPALLKGLNFINIPVFNNEADKKEKNTFVEAGLENFFKEDKRQAELEKLLNMEDSPDTDQEELLFSLENELYDSEDEFWNDKGLRDVKNINISKKDKTIDKRLFQMIGADNSMSVRENASAHIFDELIDKLKQIETLSCSVLSPLRKYVEEAEEAEEAEELYFGTVLELGCTNPDKTPCINSKKRVQRKFNIHQNGFSQKQIKLLYWAFFYFQPYEFSYENMSIFNKDRQNINDFYKGINLWFLRPKRKQPYLEKFKFSEEDNQILLQMRMSWKQNKEAFFYLLKTHSSYGAFLFRFFELSLTKVLFEEEMDSFLEKLPLLMSLGPQSVCEKSDIEQFLLNRHIFDPNNNLISSFEQYQKQFLETIEEKTEPLDEHLLIKEFISLDIIAESENLFFPKPLAFLLTKKLIIFIKKFEEKIGKRIPLPKYLIEPILMQMNADIQPLDHLKIKIGVNQESPIEIEAGTIQLSFKFIYRLYREFNPEESQRILKAIYFAHLQNMVQRLSLNKKDECDSNIANIFTHSILTALCWNKSDLGVLMSYVGTHHTFFFCPRIKDLFKAFLFFYPDLNRQLKILKLKDFLLDKTFVRFLRCNLYIGSSSQTLWEQLEALNSKSLHFLKSKKKKRKKSIVVTTAENVLLFYSRLKSMRKTIDPLPLCSSALIPESVTKKQQENQVSIARLWIKKFFESKGKSFKDFINIKHLIKKIDDVDIDNLQENLDKQEDPTYLSQLLFQCLKEFHIEVEEQKKRELESIIHPFEQDVFFPWFQDLCMEVFPFLVEMKCKDPQKFKRFTFLCYLSFNKSIKLFLDQYIFDSLKDILSDLIIEKEISLLFKIIYHNALKVFLEGENPDENNNIFASLDTFFLELSKKGHLSPDEKRTKEFLGGSSYLFLKEGIHLLRFLLKDQVNQSFCNLREEFKNQDSQEKGAVVLAIENMLEGKPYHFAKEGETPLFSQFYEQKMDTSSFYIFLFFLSQTVSLFIERSSVDFLQGMIAENKLTSFFSKTVDPLYSSINKLMTSFLMNEEGEHLKDIRFVLFEHRKDLLSFLINCDQAQDEHSQMILESFFSILLCIITNDGDENSEAFTTECIEETFFFLLKQVYEDKLIELFEKNDINITEKDCFDKIKRNPTLLDDFKNKIPYLYFKNMFKCYSKQSHSKTLEHFFYLAQDKLEENKEEFYYNVKRSYFIKTRTNSKKKSWIESRMSPINDDKTQKVNAYFLCSMYDPKLAQDVDKNNKKEQDQTVLLHPNSWDKNCQSCLTFFKIQQAWDLSDREQQPSYEADLMRILCKKMFNVFLDSKQDLSCSVMVEHLQKKDKMESLVSLLSSCLPYPSIVKTITWLSGNIAHILLDQDFLLVLLKPVDILVHLWKNDYRSIDDRESILKSIKDDKSIKSLFKSQMTKLSKKVKNLKIDSPTSQKVAVKLNELLEKNGFLVEYILYQFTDEIIDLIKSLEKKYHIVIPLPEYLIEPLKLKIKIDIDPIAPFDIEVVENQDIPIIIWSDKLCIDMDRFFILAKEDNKKLKKCLREIYFCAIQNESQVLFHNQQERRHKDFLLNSFLVSKYFATHEKTISLSWRIFHRVRCNMSPCFAYPKNIIDNFLYIDPDLEKNDCLIKLNEAISSCDKSIFKFIIDNIILNDCDRTPAEQFRSFFDQEENKQEGSRIDPEIKNDEIYIGILNRLIQNRAKENKELSALIERLKCLVSLVSQISEFSNLPDELKVERDFIVLDEDLKELLNEALKEILQEVTDFGKKIEKSTALAKTCLEMNDANETMDSSKLLEFNTKITKILEDGNEKTVLVSPDLDQQKTFIKKFQEQMVSIKNEIGNVHQIFKKTDLDFKRAMDSQVELMDSLKKKRPRLCQLKKVSSLSNSCRHSLLMLNELFKTADIIISSS